MKKVLLFFPLLYFGFSNSQNCGTPNSLEYLDINNVVAGVQNGGGLWFDGVESGSYSFPNMVNNPTVTPILMLQSGGLVIGARNINTNEIHFAGTAIQFGEGDFWSGPILSAAERITFQECELWNRHFKINQSTIDTFLLNNFPINENQLPQIIKEWPAKGNTYMQEQGMTLLNDYAPFTDGNGNGFYDPQNGDYPNIKGDQAIYWVFNDYEGPTHADFVGNKMGAEIHVMAYAYKTNNVLNETTFYDYKIINRSNSSYDNFYFSHFFDVLNGSLANHIGVDTINQYIYAYNNQDIVNCDFNTCDFVTVTSIICSEQDKNLSSYFRFIFGTDFLPNPSLDSSEYIYQIQNGNFNINQIGLFNELFAFPGNPADSTQSSECSENITPFENRYLLNTGPYHFDINQELNFTLMINTFLPISPPTCINRDLDITPAFLEAKNLYFEKEECGFKQMITSVENKAKFSYKIYPNPSLSRFNIENEFYGNYTYTIYDVTGKLIFKIQPKQANTAISIDKKGYYFLKIEEKNSTSYRMEKIIIH